MPLYPMEMCAPSMMEVPRSCAPSSSEALADMVCVIPPPPYSAGAVVPNAPISPILATTSFGTVSNSSNLSGSTISTIVLRRVGRSICRVSVWSSLRT